MLLVHLVSAVASFLLLLLAAHKPQGEKRYTGLSKNLINLFLKHICWATSFFLYNSDQCGVMSSHTVSTFWTVYHIDHQKRKE